MSAEMRFHLLFPLFRPCWGFSETLGPCWRRTSSLQGSWQQLQHPHEAFQGFCLQPQELQTSAGVISSGCCRRASCFGEQPHPKTILALPLEAQSNSQGNPLAEPRMKCYILSMSREITSGTSVNATESLRNEFLARNEPVRGGDLLNTEALLLLAVSRASAARPCSKVRTVCQGSPASSSRCVCPVCSQNGAEPFLGSQEEVTAGSVCFLQGRS